MKGLLIFNQNSRKREQRKAKAMKSNDDGKPSKLMKMLIIRFRHFNDSKQYKTEIKHILRKLQTTKNKEKILKAAEELQKGCLTAMTLGLDRSFSSAKRERESTKFLAWKPL